MSVATIGLVIAWILAVTPTQDLSVPLPELEPFLKEVRQKLRSDRSLLSQYTYTEKRIENRLDGKGNVKKTEERIYEIYPSIVRELSYERLIERDGNPVPMKELEKQDREHDRKWREHERKLEREGTSARKERLDKEAKARHEEDAVINELFHLYEIRMLRRDLLRDLPAILLDFTPRKDFKPKTDGAKVLKKVAGRVWINEADHEIIRVEAELIENYSVGAGILARLNQGATLVFQRQKVNNEIWLPSEARFTGAARVLLLKRIRMDATSQYYDYRKFTVETNIIIRREAK